MSWSLQYTSKADFEADTPQYGTPIETPEGLEQRATARAMAKAIIESGAVGDPGGDFFVNLNGHANPEHKPTSGMANDCIGVNVAQK